MWGLYFSAFRCPLASQELKGTNFWVLKEAMEDFLAKWQTLHRRILSGELQTIWDIPISKILRKTSRGFFVLFFLQIVFEINVFNIIILYLAKSKKKKFMRFYIWNMYYLLYCISYMYCIDSDLLTLIAKLMNQGTWWICILLHLCEVLL